MSAISSLPVEVWQSILRYAIEVPHFLDPDAYEGVLSRRLFQSWSPLNNEAAYWRAERRRNRMQRVSKSWDLFLRQFEHRFIRMLDVRHGKVPRQKLETATRVLFGDDDCMCSQFCFSYSFTNFIIEALGQVGSMRAEIIDTSEMHILLRSLNSPKLKNIKVLVSPLLMGEYRLNDLLRALPSLRHINTEKYERCEIEGRGILLSSNLVTLVLSIESHETYDQVMLDLPCLRYLRINSNAPDAAIKFTKAAVLNILRVVGSQLRSFYLHYVPPGNETIEEVWDLCPNMETFHTALSLVSPPLGHPIHTLHLHRVEQMEGLEPVAEWPNLRKIVLWRKWNSTDLQKRDSFVLSREKLRVEDREGLTLDENYQ